MWPYPQSPADFVTFTEEIFNEKLYFFVQWKDIKNHIYLIEISTNIGKIEKWLRRDWPRLVKTRIQQLVLYNNPWFKRTWTWFKQTWILFFRLRRETYSKWAQGTTVSFTAMSNSVKLPHKFIMNLYIVTCFYWLKKTMKMYVKLYV